MEDERGEEGRATQKTNIRSTFSIEMGKILKFHAHILCIGHITIYNASEQIVCMSKIVIYKVY